MRRTIYLTYLIYIYIYISGVEAKYIYYKALREREYKNDRNPDKTRGLTGNVSNRRPLFPLPAKRPAQIFVYQICVTFICPFCIICLSALHGKY